MEKFGTYGVKGNEENSCVRYSIKEGDSGRTVCEKNSRLLL